jgi:NCS1 family nucleobase:cation symporter-1
MIKAIWPSVVRIPNKLDGSITTTGMLCYFLFWLLQLPFLFISPHGLRWLFMLKALTVPPTFLAMMIWAFATTGGGVIFHQKGTLSGTALAWAWFGALNSTLGNFSTLAVNIPDFTRYARSEREYVLIPNIFPNLTLSENMHLVNMFSSSLFLLHSPL